jgi:ferredoxin-thioredoxin reductase catalytic subunit
MAQNYKIKVSEDKEVVEAIKEGLKKNGGYCPCRIERTSETKCMCKEFREQTEGECHCGLYVKVGI